MTIPMILAPLFVLVLMTFVLGILLAALRGPALTRGEVRPRRMSICASRTGRRARSRSAIRSRTSSNCRCCSTC